MLIHGLEDLMYQVSGLFLAPVLVLLVALFAYSLFALGEFAMQGWQRKKNASSFLQALKRVPEESSDIPAGYSLLALYAKDSSLSKDGLDVAALKELEAVRMVSRIAPMLGLIATMIPMGPALKSLSNGNIQGISENLIVQMENLLEQHPGKCSFKVNLVEETENIAVDLLSRKFMVNPNDELLKSLEGIPEIQFKVNA